MIPVDWHKGSNVSCWTIPDSISHQNLHLFTGFSIARFMTQGYMMFPILRQTRILGIHLGFNKSQYIV